MMEDRYWRREGEAKRLKGKEEDGQAKQTELAECQRNKSQKVEAKKRCTCGRYADRNSGERKHGCETDGLGMRFTHTK